MMMEKGERVGLSLQQDFSWSPWLSNSSHSNYNGDPRDMDVSSSSGIVLNVYTIISYIGSSGKKSIPQLQDPTSCCAGSPKFSDRQSTVKSARAVQGVRGLDAGLDQV